MDDVDWGYDDEEIQEYFEDFEGVTLETDNTSSDGNAQVAPTRNGTHSNFVLPGTELADCRLSKVTGGAGCYRQGDVLIASVPGIKHEEGSVISVRPTTGNVNGLEGPRPGSIVLARVIRVTPRHVTCDIFSVDGVLQTNCCRGHVRPADVFPILLDHTSLLDCFHPGDVIRAQVIATGMSRNFLLSTVAPEYGVIRGYDEDSGEILELFASRLMRNPRDGKLCWRKAAFPGSNALD